MGIMLDESRIVRKLQGQVEREEKVSRDIIVYIYIIYSLITSFLPFHFLAQSGKFLALRLYDPPILTTLTIPTIPTPLQKTSER